MLPEDDLRMIDEAAAAMDDDLIILRRAIHRQPELAGHEHNTAALVAEQLDRAGLEVSAGVGGHGVVGVLHGSGAGPTVAYRSDMDAVAMDEEFESEFRSRVDGAAHLCGHDVHTTVGVGAARVLARMRDRLDGSVVFYFQPAEETLTGAQAMLDDGVLEHTMPEEIYALHCAYIDVGTFAVMPGVGQPGLDSFDLELEGPRAHEQANLVAAGIGALSTVRIPTTAQEYQQLLTDLQSEDGPLARFVFAGAGVSTGQDDTQAQVHGWIRAWPDDRYPSLRKEVAELVRATCGPSAQARLRFPDPVFPAMVCSPDLSLAAAEFLRAAGTPDRVLGLRACFPFNGEDFALFLDKIPGAMFVLGVANPAAGLSGIVHTPTFAADERAIGIGTRAMAGWLANRIGVLSGRA